MAIFRQLKSLAGFTGKETGNFVDMVKKRSILVANGY
jgi:hypothetical protein